MELTKKLKLKNEQLFEAIKAAEKNDFSHLTPEAAKPFIDKMSPTQLGMIYMVGYLSSLIEISEHPRINLKLDLTYETVGNLPVVIAQQFMISKNSGYSLEECTEIAHKTIATYLTLLATNQHGLTITGKQTRLDPYNLGKNFSGISISVNKLFMQCDFLDSTSGSVKYRPNEVTVFISTLCKAYKILTGVNLREYGMDDLEASFV